MPINEKEYNGYLFDQLELVERLEIVVKEGGDILKQLDFERKMIERKLYQQPPLIQPTGNDNNN